MVRKRIRKSVYFTILVVILAGALGSSRQSIVAEADNIQDIMNQIDATQNHLDDVNNRIDELNDQQDLVEEMIADLSAEIVNTMTSIGLKQDEIARKEQELLDKQQEIDVVQAEYEEAKAQEEKQHDDMLIRMRAMYENENYTYLNLLLTGDGLADVLNRMDYVETLYQYDRIKLEEYQETRQRVLDLWNTLEAEKQQLKEDQIRLEADQAALQAQEEELNVLLEQRKRESANYEAEIAKAKQEAAVAKKQLQKEQQELKKLQSQQQRNDAANGTYTTDYNGIINDASGSELGKQIARFACQYVGNPYVSGGTSLTNGADCSGFTYRVYQNFGYTLPRTSTEQRGAGTEVSYSEAQPGDLICYSGHVALYIGGGKIVHASTPASGIKVSNAAYREILTVRRIV